MPVFVGLGNHDRRIPFRQIYLGEGEARDEGERYDYGTRVGNLRLLMLDSLVPGELHGELGATQLAWLAEQLREPAPGGDLVVLHHPVLPRGLPRATDNILGDADALRAALQGRPILGVLAGHSHVVSAAPFAGTLALTAPAGASLFDPGTTSGIRPLAGTGFNLCTVRDGTLIVNPIIVPGATGE